MNTIKKWDYYSLLEKDWEYSIRKNEIEKWREWDIDNNLWYMKVSKVYKKDYVEKTMLWNLEVAEEYWKNVPQEKEQEQKK